MSKAWTGERISARISVLVWVSWESSCCQETNSRMLSKQLGFRTSLIGTQTHSDWAISPSSHCNIRQKGTPIRTLTLQYKLRSRTNLTTGPSRRENLYWAHSPSPTRSRASTNARGTRRRQFPKSKARIGPVSRVEGAAPRSWPRKRKLRGQSIVQRTRVSTTSIKMIKKPPIKN
jgi:hypothetical protein